MIVLAAVLTLSAALICCVKILKPERLTNIVSYYANKTLDADVTIGRVALSFEPAFPNLKLDIDSLSIVSKAFTNLSQEHRAIMPEWSDSLLTFDHFEGKLNVGALLSKGEIALNDIELVGAGLNVVYAYDGNANYNIYNSTNLSEQKNGVEDELQVAADSQKIPSLSLNHFAFINPREIRYFNAKDSIEASVLLFNEVKLDKKGEPIYSMRTNGHFTSPLTKQFINLENISFGLDGNIHWTPEKPQQLAFDNFTINGAFIESRIAASLDFTDTLAVNSAKIDFSPVKISDILSVLPDSMRRANKLIAPYFSTDGTIALHAELTEPFRPAADSLPAARVNLAMPDCHVHYGNAEFKQFGFDLAANLQKNNLDKAVIDIKRLEVAGPATHLKVDGSVSCLLSDPAFQGKVDGDIELQNLPSIIADYAGGFLKGHVTAKLSAKGKTSMFTENSFHMLDIKGKLEGSNLYYLSNDIAKMADIKHATVLFGSQVHLKRDTTKAGTSPMLAAALKIDSANVLIDGVNITMSDLSLGAGVENMPKGNDTTVVIPLGGGLNIRRINIESISDSAGARIRNISGKVRLQRYKGRQHLPEILANLEVGRLSAGTIDTRVLLSKAKVDVSTHKLPSRKRKYGKGQHSHVGSSNHKHRNISPDSVYKLARQKHRHRTGEPRHRRVQAEITNNDVEILEWDLSKGLKQFLLEWKLQGQLSTRNARLFTPMFPLRNRISHLDVTFSNDSVSINNLIYTAGRSDLAMTGLVSNIKKGLTTNDRYNPLKINIEIVSDTVDVNQLAAAAFAGASYMERIRNGALEVNLNVIDDEDELEQHLGSLNEGQTDSICPILVPTNIDAMLRLKAANIMYSDLEMTRLRGNILVYDGGINMRNLSAKSDAGDLQLSALYSAPALNDMHFGFGLDLKNFNIERFLTLVPAIDSILPIMRDFSGIINADVAATVDIDNGMNMVLPTLDAALKLTGDSLAFINPKTYATIGKWLLFRDRNDNKIKHINVDMVVHDNMLQVFPFSFDIDRYRLGIAGYNDLNMNFDYHLSVLKSPLPFKFGVSVKGNPDKYKVRFGGAKFKEDRVAESVSVVDTARVNLIQQIEGVFRRGVRNSRFAKLNVNSPNIRQELEQPDPGLSAADSLALIREGLIEDPIDIKALDR